MNANEIGLVAAAFALVGAGAGIVGAAATGWAEAALATAATGETARFGPVFVAQSYLAVTAAVLVGAVPLAGVLGVLVGSRARGVTAAAVTCGLGTGLGALAYGLVAVTMIVVSQGDAAAQAHGLADASVPTVATAFVAAAVGASTGVLGTVMR
ncbi:hypothetical protein [Halorubrum ezzemoulense]|uniref:Uncharacterized protein n=1 Tax=Halorubrum ezzemoulense TaxID=337243 RepID=A0A256JBA2_HALEZ|nr:hypothetical protein [Halorubrum ezzemoulense]MDB2237897.1 hypothetical protein [Halorubrum ezzemoulense]MDB2240509.1 hypothetical protein [Halorubrum ezzemoulense]MDB2249491.1 hypothetical protein [Halorubrum ezzemoulense]OYR66059.1 hypothetical protein DJ79_13950 [Halorubrum ezzemoulense]OYR71717.1 hypothetical protein DJ76_14060 [Halorubrum ezzemoulense]